MPAQFDRCHRRRRQCCTNMCSAATTIGAHRLVEAGNVALATSVGVYRTTGDTSRYIDRARSCAARVPCATQVPMTESMMQLCTLLETTTCTRSVTAAMHAVAHECFAHSAAFWRLCVCARAAHHRHKMTTTTNTCVVGEYIVVCRQCAGPLCEFWRCPPSTRAHTTHVIDPHIVCRTCLTIDGCGTVATIGITTTSTTMPIAWVYDWPIASPSCSTTPGLN